MILAAYQDGLFKVLFLGHMLSFVLAFAPAIVNPLLAAKVKRAEGDDALVRVTAHLLSNGRQVHFPALVALGGFGIAMVLVSDPVLGFSDAWVSHAFLERLAICGMVTGVMIPGERKVASGDLEAEKRLAMGGQVITVLTLAMLYLMIWKPGA